jgi:hypothetical protein
MAPGFAAVNLPEEESRVMIASRGLEEVAIFCFARSQRFLCPLTIRYVDPDREKILSAFVTDLPAGPMNRMCFAVPVEYAKFQTREPVSEHLSYLCSHAVTFVLDYDCADVKTPQSFIGKSGLALRWLYRQGRVWHQSIRLPETWQRYQFGLDELASLEPDEYST